MLNPYFHLLRTSWKYVHGQRRKFLFAYAFLAFSNVLVLLQPYVMGKVFDTIQLGGEQVLRNATLLLFLYAGLSFVFWIFHGIGRIWERETAFHINQQFRQTLFSIVTNLPIRWHRDHHSGETQDKIEKAAGALHHFGNSGFQIISTIISAIVSIVAVLLYVPMFGAIALPLCIIAFFVIKHFNTVLTKNRRQVNEQEHKVASLFYDYISNIRTVITLRLEDQAGKKYAESIANIFPYLKREMRVNEFKWFNLNLMVNATIFLTLFAYIYKEVHNGEVVMLGGLVALYGYISRFSSAFFNVSGQWEALEWQSTDMSAADSLVQAHAELQEQAVVSEIPEQWEQIDIHNLWFQYQDQNNRKHHLDNASITLKRGMSVALVGKSGSGKSTLLTLLRGLENADAVDIQVDGKPASGLRVLSTATTLIPQDPELFDNTVEYNVTAGIEHNEQEVSQACELSRFTSVLEQLPHGLATGIKERGVNMSGGQKQRLALARGVFAAKNSSIILLDEPTSSVDPENELNIYRNLFMHFSDRCIVSSIHRLHLLPLFDMIYVMEDGRIVEKGSLSDLLAKEDGTLKNMWENYSAHTSSPQNSPDTQRVKMR